MPHVFSTITSDVSYCEYEGEDTRNIRQIKRRITIKGGANVIDKRLITPRGAVTHVSDDELAFLEKNESFRRHKERGFITVSNKSADPEKVALDMTPKDDSAPKTEEDFTAQETDDGVKTKVVVNKKKERA